MDTIVVNNSVTATTTTGRLKVPEPLRAPELSSGGGSNSKAKELYWDRSHYQSHQAQIEALKKSSTVYVGNLNFSTLSRHVMAHFSSLGPIVKVYMGLDRYQKTPCGFCFVEYLERKHALQAVSVLSGTKLSGNIIRVELDAGFQAGRQYGRGAKGGQTRHDRRQPGGGAGATAIGNKRSRSLEETPPLPPPPPLPAEMGGYQPSAPSDPADVALFTPRDPQHAVDENEEDDSEMADGPATKRQRVA